MEKNYTSGICTFVSTRFSFFGVFSATVVRVYSRFRLFVFDLESFLNFYEIKLFRPCLSFYLSYSALGSWIWFVWTSSALFSTFLSVFYDFLDCTEFFVIFSSFLSFSVVFRFFVVLGFFSVVFRFLPFLVFFGRFPHFFYRFSYLLLISVFFVVFVSFAHLNRPPIPSQSFFGRISFHSF